MVFQQFINLRDELSQVAFNANCFSTLAAGVDHSVDLSDGDLQLNGYVCRKQGNYFKILKVVVDEFDVKGLTPVYSNQIGTLDDHLSDVIEGTSLTVSDFLETASATGDLYSSLAMITQKYSYSNRISLQDLFYQIDNINAIKSLNYDVNDLKTQLLSVSDDSGFVSNRTWLAALSGWIEACKNGADDESLELDNTSPTVLSGLYSIVTSVVSATITALFALIGAIFGTIWTIVGIALSNLFSAIMNDINESAELDVESTNTFVQGPIIAREESYNGASQPLYELVSNNKKIIYTNFGGSGLFFWRGPESSQTVRLNAYAHPIWSPESIYRETIIERDHKVTFTESSGVYTLKKSVVTATKEFNPSVTDDEINRMQNDLGYYCACLIATEMVRWIRATPYDAYFDNDNHDNKLVWSDHAQTVSVNSLDSNPWIAIIQAGMALLVGIARDMDAYGLLTSDSIYRAISYQSVIDICNLWIQDAYSKRNNFTSLNPALKYWNLDSTWQNTTIFTFMNPLITTFNYGENQTRYEGLWFNWTSTLPSGVYGWSITGYGVTLGDTIEADMMPTNFFVKFKSLTSSQIVNAIVLTSMIAIAGSVVALKVSKAIRLKKLKKSFRRSETINDKKAIYDDYRNPNRQGGPKTPEEINTALDDYVKTVDKYNRMGRILGWGSYDIKNGWMNGVNSGDSNPILMSSVIDMFQGSNNTNASKILEQNQTLSNAISLILDDKLSTIHSEIDRIYKLIK